MGEHAEEGEKRLFVVAAERDKCVIHQGLKSVGQEGLGEEAAAEEHREEVGAHLPQGVVVETPGVNSGGTRGQHGKRRLVELVWIQKHHRQPVEEDAARLPRNGTTGCVLNCRAEREEER